MNSNIKMIDNDDWYSEMVDIQMKIELNKVMKNLIQKQDAELRNDD